MFHPPGVSESLDSTEKYFTLALADGFLMTPFTLILQTLNTSSGMPVPHAPAPGRSPSAWRGCLCCVASPSVSHVQ